MNAVAVNVTHLSLETIHELIKQEYLLSIEQHGDEWWGVVVEVDDADVFNLPPKFEI